MSDGNCGPICIYIYIDIYIYVNVLGRCAGQIAYPFWVSLVLGEAQSHYPSKTNSQASIQWEFQDPKLEVPTIYM